MPNGRVKREATADKLQGKEVLLYINYGDTATATYDAPSGHLLVDRQRRILI